MGVVSGWANVLRRLCCGYDGPFPWLIRAHSSTADEWHRCELWKEQYLSRKIQNYLGLKYCSRAGFVICVVCAL